MAQTYAARKKTDRRDAGAVSKGMPVRNQVPNSAFGAALQEPDAGGFAVPGLEQQIFGRQPGIKPQAQIPQAESEADRLSASVTTGSPEMVKAAMGRRMGADFSGVRFHTDAAATARADAMGARAFTSGADVYFGSGGYDAAIAAHELVHTAQQGMVSSGVQTMATPVGGVQMMPHPFKKAWEKTGGRIIRKHHDAIDQLHQAVQDGSWDELSNEEQKAWIRKNPIAARRYFHNKTVQEKSGARIQKRNQEKEAAAAFLSSFSKNSTSMLGDDVVPVEEEAPESSAWESGLEKAGEISEGVDKATILPGLIDTAQEAKWIGDFGGDALGNTLGIAGVATGLIGTAQSATKDLPEAIVNGDKWDVADASVDLASNLSQLNGSILSLGGDVFDSAASGLDIVSGAADVYKGARQIHKGRMQSNAMTDFKNKHFEGRDRNYMLKNDRLMLDIATQGKMEGTRQKIKGSGKVVTGAMDAAAGIAELSGAGASASAALKVGSKVAKGGFAIANHVQKKRMAEKVTEQTTNLTNDDIKAFQKQNHIRSFSRAKQALMKASGYESGQRAELFADQTAKRGQKLAELATSGDEKARELVAGLQIDTDGEIQGSAIAEALGKKKSREDILGRTNLIKQMLARKRAAAGSV